MKKRFTFISVLLVFFCVNAFSQSKSVKGRVSDENDQPLPGVSIKISSTKRATVSDGKGNFAISAQVGDTIVCSYIGYKVTKVPVTAELMYIIKLAPSNIALNETVVIGYQSISRRSVTTAVSSVSSKDIAPTTTSNVGDALQGKVPGLQVIDGGGTPGASPKLLVRGFATVTGSSNPLIVVDGVVTSFGSLNDINPSDIASVDVLKDAAATAIYGSRGGEGVIIITTKRGANGKTVINFNGTSGLNHLENPNMAGTTEYVNFYKKVYGSNNQTLPPNGAVSDVNTNWWNAAIKNAYTHNYNLSLSGEKNGLSFYGSVGYFDQQSNYNAQRGTGDYQKITTRFNIDYKISRMFKIGVNLAPRFETYGDGGGTNLTTVMLIAPNVPITKSVAQTANDVNAYAATNPGWDFTAYNPIYSQFTRSDFNNINNPIAQMARDFNNTKYFGTQGSTYLEFKPIKNLTFRTSLSGFYDSSNQTNYIPKYYIDPQDHNDKSQVSQNTVEDYRWQIDNTLNYIGSINDHHFNILVGQSADNYVYQNSYVYREDVPYDSDPYRYVSAGATLVDASGSYQPGAGPFGKMSSYFSRVQYDYKDTYYLSGSFRADGSSLLSPQNRWGYFPTISGAYIITNERFMQNIKWLNSLKLRSSFGRVGGNLPSAPGAYESTLGLTDYVNGDRTRVYGYTPSSVPDPNIKWETTQDVTVGLDADLFNNRLSVSADKYWRSPKDMLLYLPIQPSLGYPQGYIPTVYTNVGNMKTSGYELAVNYKDKVGKVNYGISLTVSHFLSRATDLKGQVLTDNISNDVFQTTQRTRTAAGDILGGFYGYQVIGVFQNQEQINNYKSADGTVLQPNARPGDFMYKNVNGDDKIDLNDRTNLGSPYPKLTSGLTLQASYAGFDFRTEFYGSFGNKVADDYLVRMNPIYNYNFISGLENKFWNGPGSTNTYPILSLTDQNGNFSNFSSFYVKDGSYVRCRLMQLGYTLPKQIMKNIGSIRLFVSAQNVFTITKYPGLNPEVPFSSILTYGIDNGQNPLPRFFSAGFNANF